MKKLLLMVAMVMALSSCQTVMDHEDGDVIAATVILGGFLYTSIAFN